MAERHLFLLTMQVKLTGNMKNKFNGGSSTIEILIAFTVLIMTLSAVILIIFSNQSVSVDTQTNHEAMYKTEKVLEGTFALAKQNFLSVESSTTQEISGPITYLKTLSVSDLTQCKKQAKVTTTWSLGPLRPQKIEFNTYLVDGQTALALGGDCITDPPTSNWNNPTRFASDTTSPGKPLALDELNKIVYLGVDKSPFLAIADTDGAFLGQNSGLLVSFTNGFDAGHEINSIDAVRYPSLNKNYAFAAINSSTQQLASIDVTNILKPTAVFRGLSACVTGSEPQGNLVYFYKNTLYLTTLFTAGPEFHIFDVSNPANPTEYSIGSVGCKGLDLGDSVNDMVIQDQLINGVIKRYAYMATDEDDKELRVFDVTNPLSILEVTAANQDLPGIQNGLSVFASGNKLYFGRQSTPGGSELYVYDISNPSAGLTLLGSKDVGTGVQAIRVAGRFAFIATPKVTKEFQILDISDPTNISVVQTYNFGNVVNRGIDYDPDFIYSTGQSTPNLQIIYSP